VEIARDSEAGTWIFRRDGIEVDRPLALPAKFEAAIRRETRSDRSGFKRAQPFSPVCSEKSAVEKEVVFGEREGKTPKTPLKTSEN
jgi:hypothetical protein